MIDEALWADSAFPQPITMFAGARCSWSAAGAQHHRGQRTVLRGG